MLKELAATLPPDPVIVNIGAGERAISTLAVLEERPDAFIFSIDIHAKENEGINLRRAGLDHTRVVRILGRSQEAGLHWPFEVDMVIVDGDHTYDGVRGDMVWLSKIKTGGIIAFHDHSPPKKRKETVAQLSKEADVKRAVDERMGDCEVLAHVERFKAFLIEGGFKRP